MTIIVKFHANQGAKISREIIAQEVEDALADANELAIKGILDLHYFPIKRNDSCFQRVKGDVHVFIHVSDNVELTREVKP